MECMAGLDEYPWEDVSRDPRWLCTEGLVNPWDDASPSPLLAIPKRAYAPHTIFRKDPFHVFKQTIGGHFVASSVVLLLDLGYWHTPGFNAEASVLLELAYEDFNFFLKKEWPGKQVAHLKTYTKALLHWPRSNTFPYGRFKGSDCMLMIRWLRHFALHGRWVRGSAERENVDLRQRPWLPFHAPLFQQIWRGASASLEFFKLLHTNGVFLCPSIAESMAECSFQFCQAYQSLAEQCHQLDLRRYHLEPSLHYFHHYYTDLMAKVRANHPWVMSPACDNAESDEDFVGRLARLSRCCHAGSVTHRVIDRYLIKCYFSMTGQDWSSASNWTGRSR